MTDWGAHHFGGATFAVDVREFQPNKVAVNLALTTYGCGRIQH